MTNTLRPETVRERLDELVELWFAEDFRARVQTRDNPLVGLTIFAHVAHAHTLVRAMRLLDNAEEHAATIPLARVVLECAVTAMWTETYGERAVLILQRDYVANRIATFSEFIESGVEDDPSVVDGWREYLDDLEAVARERAGKFSERCDELEGMGGTYGMFRAFSSMSHSGGTLMDVYLQDVPVSESARHGIMLRRTPAEWAHEAVLGQTLVYTLLAAMTWDRMSDAHTNRTRLKEIAAEMGFALKWTQSTQGFLAQQAWNRRQKEDARPVKPVAADVTNKDRELVGAVDKATRELVAHRWHWTLDATNRARVPVRDYAQRVGQNREKLERQIEAEQKRRRNVGRP